MILTKKKALSLFAVISVVIGIGVLSGFSSSDSLSTEKADLVVYGKIFTSEGNQMVEAFAVKDGKYIYVGDKAGAEALVEEGKTEVIDYSGKGLVMPSCGNGHAHYSMAYAINTVGTVVEMTDNVEKVFQRNRTRCCQESQGDWGNDCLWPRLGSDDIPEGLELP